MWVITQLGSQLHALDPDTLVVTQSLDFGLFANRTLSVDRDIRYPDRQTLFLTFTADNVMIEFDPLARAEVGRWSLIGGRILNDASRRRVQPMVVDGGIVIIRTNDGSISRMNLESGALTSAKLSSDAAWAQAALEYPDLGYPYAVGGLVYAGQFAMDAATLLMLTERDLQGDALAAVLAEGSLIAYRKVDYSLGLELRPDGAPTIVMHTADPFAPAFIEDKVGGRLLCAEPGCAAVGTIRHDSLAAQ